MTQMKFPHWFFWRPRSVVLPDVPFLDLSCISSWADISGSKCYTGDNVSVCQHPRRHGRMCGQDAYKLSSYLPFQCPRPVGFSTQSRPWLESTSPFGAESGNLQILLFFCLKSFIHLCFFFFSKEELCPYCSFSTPLTHFSVYQFWFIFSKLSVYNPSLLLFFLKLSVPIAPPVAKGASSVILLCPLGLVPVVRKKVVSLAPRVLVWAGLFLVPSDLPPGTPSANTHSHFNGHWVSHLLIPCSFLNLLIILALFPQFLLVRP